MSASKLAMPSLRMLRRVVVPSRRCLRGMTSSTRQAGYPQHQQQEGPAGGLATSTTEPLFLWIDDKSLVESSHLDAAANKFQQLGVPLLLPALSLSANTNSSAVVTTSDDVVDAVSRRYGHDEGDHQFVGGMGESDPGVWFASRSRSSQFDAVLYSDLIVESIMRVKEERHGVPFAVCTTGLFTVPPTASLLELAECVDCLHVSLHASTPNDYQQCTGLSNLDDAKRALGTVCSFISEAVDHGVPVEAWVNAQFAGPSRDLALSLGARNVHAA